jgi:serine/threonine protein kinase/Tol biopolymer transport system component
MALVAGIRLGSYEVLSLLGVGGMGEVYRARDTKLGRSVAIKVLPAALADDPERIARFEREARALASLNHPNIATLYGLEVSDHDTHRHLLVMELVEGETLADRLRRGPLPLEAALAVARQIAEALEAAHERGIVHRDLKPANVKLTGAWSSAPTPGASADRLEPTHSAADGAMSVKLLDFGLAKAMESQGDGSRFRGHDPSPTTAIGTQAGVILGTAAYMSPEQARGLPADHRSDIFAFGAVLFEMLSGQRPFHGDTVSDVLASVIAREADLSALPAGLNPRLPDLIRRCLAKAPRQRWQAIGDVRVELEIIAVAPLAIPASATPDTATPMPIWKRAIPALGLVLLSSAITGGLMWRSRAVAPSPVVTRFSLTLANPLGLIGTQRNVIALSPNGRLLAFSAGAPVGLYVRAMDSLDAHLVRGSDGPTPPVGPVFSPDGQALVYWSQMDQALKRIPTAGGAPFTLCPTDLPSGLSWSVDGIVFANTEGILRVPAEGGPPDLLVKATSGEIQFGPQLLPGGRELLFTSADASGGSERWDAGRVIIQTLGTGERRTIIDGGTDARYVASGHLVFGRRGVVYAAPFDLARLALTGREVPVIEGVMRGTGTYGSGTLNMTVSDDGTLAFLPGPLEPVATSVSLARFDRAGKWQTLGAPSGSYQTPRLSPDGLHAAFVVDDGKDVNVWVYDVGSDRAPRRLTFGGRCRSPAWSADGRRIAYRSDRDGAMAVYWQPADGSGAPERITTPEAGATDIPLSFSSDGAWLLFERLAAGRTTVWTFSIRDRRATRFDAVESTQLTGALFSPDAKWVAYALREPGRSNQIYVEPFPPTGAKYLASNSLEDAHHPLWSADGTELFYTPGPGSRLIRVPVTFTPSVSFGAASVIERPFSNLASSSDRPYDMTRDGRFFSLTDPLLAAGGLHSITVVLNWFAELRALAPSGK